MLRGHSSGDEEPNQFSSTPFETLKEDSCDYISDSPRQRNNNRTGSEGNLHALGLTPHQYEQMVSSTQSSGGNASHIPTPTLSPAASEKEALMLQNNLQSTAVNRLFQGFRKAPAHSIIEIEPHYGNNSHETLRGDKRGFDNVIENNTDDVYQHLRSASTGDKDTQPEPVSSKPMSVRRRCASLMHCFLQDQVWKFGLAVTYLLGVMTLISHILVFVHLRIPTNETWGAPVRPLPDLVLQLVPRQSWGFVASEMMISTLSLTTLVLTIFHQNRLVVARRFCCISGSVFLLRAACVCVTSLTQCSPHLADVCPPLQLRDTQEFFERAFRILVGVGLRIQGGQSCGDYIYSGHTCSLTIFNLLICTYGPGHPFFLPLKVGSCILNFAGALCILLAHEHYTVDVVLGFFITLMIFTDYHNVAHNPELRRRDRLRIRLTSPLAYFMERNGEGKLVNHYNIPLCHHFIVQRWSRFRLGRQKRNTQDQQSRRVLS
jgi:shingomyelin synthase